MYIYLFLWIGKTRVGLSRLWSDMIQEAFDLGTVKSWMRSRLLCYVLDLNRRVGESGAQWFLMVIFKSVETRNGNGAIVRFIGGRECYSLNLKYFEKLNGRADEAKLSQSRDAYQVILEGGCSVS